MEGDKSSMQRASPASFPIGIGRRSTSPTFSPSFCPRCSYSRHVYIPLFASPCNFIILATLIVTVVNLALIFITFFTLVKMMMMIVVDITIRLRSRWLCVEPMGSFSGPTVPRFHP